MFNYKDLAFTRQHGQNFDVMSFSYLDYNCEIREVTITWSSVGRKTIWIAEFSGLTTEYSGTLSEVLEKVYKHYKDNQYQKLKPVNTIK